MTEYEIYQGMLKYPSAEKFSFALYRNIKNIDSYVKLRRGQKFVDIVPDTCRIDEEAKQLLYKLKTYKVPK